MMVEKYQVYLTSALCLALFLNLGERISRRY